MGLEIGVIIAGISAAVGVVGQVAASGAAAASAAAQKEANAIGAAQTKVDSLESRRQRIREERIRKAQILAASENTGTSGSSGQIGAIGALSTNIGGLIAQSSGQSKTNAGINKNNQKAADYDTQAQIISGFTGAIQNGLNSFGSIFDQ